MPHSRPPNKGNSHDQDDLPPPHLIDQPPSRPVHRRGRRTRRRAARRHPRQRVGHAGTRRPTIRARRLHPPHARPLCRTRLFHHAPHVERPNSTDPCRSATPMFRDLTASRAGLWEPAGVATRHVRVSTKPDPQSWLRTAGSSRQRRTSSRTAVPSTSTPTDGAAIGRRSVVQLPAVHRGGHVRRERLSSPIGRRARVEQA